MTFTAPSPGPLLKWLGGNVDVRVEVDTGLGPEAGGLWGEDDWDEGVWASSEPGWFDLSPYVMQVDIDSGSERWGSRYQAGTLAVLVDNTSGIFTKGSNVTKPFHQPLIPNRRIRVIAVPDFEDEIYHLYTGAVDDINDSYQDGAGNLQALITATDFLGKFNRFDPLALETPTGVQTTDERVNAALDRMGWPDDADHRDIQEGEHTMQSSFLAWSTLEECQRAADAEGGAFFISPDGKATFKSRDWLENDSRSINVQGYIGFDESPIPSVTPIDVKTSRERIRIRNKIMFARTGSTVQTSEDGASQSLFDVQSYQRFDFENNSDDEIQFLADRYLDYYKDDLLRVEEITLVSNLDDEDDALNEMFYRTLFGDRFAVNIRTQHTWSFNIESQVRRIIHRITAHDWTLTLGLDAATDPNAVSVIVGWPDTEGSIPEDWERVAELDGLYIKGANGEPGSLGGSASHTHTTSGHTHTIPSHSHTQGNTGAPTGSTITSNEISPGSDLFGAALNHVHSRPNTNTSGSGPSGSTSPGTSAASNEVPHKALIFIRPLTFPPVVPIGAVAMSNDASAPSGWANETTGMSNGLWHYLKGAIGNGSKTRVNPGSHTHTVNAHTHSGAVHSHSSANSGQTTNAQTSTASSGPTSPYIARTNEHRHPITINNAESGTLQSESGGTTGSGTQAQLHSRNVGLVEKTGASNDVGIIAIWLGSIDSIPEGWVLCNGFDGTPDLRGRYPEIRQTSGSWEIGTARGQGAHHHTTPTHTHTGSSHNHSVTIDSHTMSGGRTTGSITRIGTHAHSSTNTNSATPSVNLQHSGNTSSATPEPSHREVAFIMKVSA